MKEIVIINILDSVEVVVCFFIELIMVKIIEIIDGIIKDCFFDG